MDGLHLHASVLDGLIVAAYLVLILALGRVLAAKFAETPWGKALAFLL